MEFPNALKIMIAKTCNGRSDLWLPVWIHLTDTAGIIRLLVTQRYANLSEIAGTDADKMEKTAVLAALLHDIAKITPLFQAKLLQFLPDRAGAFEKYFLPIAPYGAFVNASNSPHNFAGEAILLKLGFPADFASVIGAHHGKPADNGAVQTNIEDFPSNYYGVKHTPERWEELWRQWTQYALTTSGFTGADEIPALTKRAQVLLSGLLVTADWISSNREYFPLIPADETPGEADYPPDRIENAWNKAGFPGLWEPMWTSLSPDQFNAQFGFSPNSVQKRMLEITASCENPGMFILEAPMGTGKTEAALACAELLAHKCKKTGIFFGLPTQSTANGIFPRIRDWASEQSFENFDDIYSINLVHKNAGFVPAFRDIPGESSLDGDGDSNLVAHSFFSGRKQSCLSDFVVATVDQLLMAALKRKHNMLTHLGLSQKVVIIDECHAYDAYMNRYLDRALEWLSAYGVPVILLSATLPERRRRELIAAYLRGAPALETKAAAGNEYPLLSWTDGEKAYREAISYDGDTHTVEIIRGTDDEACAQAEKAAAAGRLRRDNNEFGGSGAGLRRAAFQNRGRADYTFSRPVYYAGQNG